MNALRDLPKARLFWPILTLVALLLLVFAMCVIAANFFMDLLNLVLDPRVRNG